MNKKIYQMSKINKLDIRKIIIFLFIIAIIITLIMIAQNSIKVIDDYKIYQEYQAQLATMKKEEEEI